MKTKLIFAAVSLIFASAAHAESWLTMEVGLGASIATDIKGVWQQDGAPVNKVTLTTPAYMAGLTGDAFDLGNWSLHWHADYVYMGSQSASCQCVTDAAYAAHNYSGPSWHFSGSGHVQGIAFTIEPGYTWHGTRFAVEGGPFLFWQTWHEDTNAPGIPSSFNAFGGGTLGYVLGARIEHGHWGVSYRFYKNSPQWRSMPGLIKQESVLMATFKF